jgi:hypothetical protein
VLLLLPVPLLLLLPGGGAAEGRGISLMLTKGCLGV